jgi:excinuclease ABC subunit B
VASVSCIYGLGSPEEYERVNLKIANGMEMGRNELIRRLIDIHFTRTNADIKNGQFRALGNSIEIMPVNDRTIYKIVYDGLKISEIIEIDPVTRSIRANHENVYIFPAKHFISDDDSIQSAIESIQAELKDQLKKFEKENKVIEAERIKRRIKYDLSMLREIGYVNGIENYSRHFSKKNPGEPPDTLLSYFPHNKDGKPEFLTVIDESHVTVPQLNGMFAGDASRKNTLIEHGFRLPSARDNRPLKFEEFRDRVGNIIYTSATPGKYEIEHSKNVAEQIIRPTGLIDPVVVVKPITENKQKGYSGQIKDFMSEATETIKRGDRVLATTLTKKMAEDLTDYLKDEGFKVSYLHSDIKTIERITILTDFRKGKYDCLIGVNLLREGRICQK